MTNLAEKQNNIMKRVIFLMNQYHSIDLRYISESVKHEMKDQIKKTIKELMRNFGEEYKILINSSFRSREVWNMIREQHFS